jgi:hypothetical protein
MMARRFFMHTVLVPAAVTVLTVIRLATAAALIAT